MLRPKRKESKGRVSA